MRVGALFGTREADKVVEFFGYGDLVGDEVPTTAVGPLAEMAKVMERANPKIKLDSGLVVWGCECWWGPEEKIKAQIAHYEEDGWTVKNVNIDEVRAAHRSDQRLTQQC